ncbi:MAG TPA: UbiD family decarboxylase [Solirubrobacteraceae bacterium]|jgi:UbiD family decarboxylase|nr:UbiD family decarboxylase [Solirubrobacteraceae bacterium]
MLSLRDFIAAVERDAPDDLVHVHEPVDPSKFEATALLQHLENAGRYPMVLFHRPLNLLGEVSEFPLVMNIYARRERCAQALGMARNDFKLPLSLEYAAREQGRLDPVRLSTSEAPVKEVVKAGEDIDLRELPIVRHHHMDPAPYIDMAPIMRDPDSGAYNIAYLRMMYKGPRKLGLHMSPRHNWQITRKHEERGLPTPVAIIVSHHPAFFLGGLNVAPFGADDYEVIGAIAGEPIRLVPSETWGEDFMVPADADMIIEGVVPPGVREVEGPFGEFPGTYGPQRLRWIIDVTAVTHRRDAIYQDIFVGHPDDRVQGGIPKEGRLFNRIKGVVPTVKAVHLPPSGVCRFHCYISIDKRVDGESKQAALIALGEVDFIKHVFVVDGDVDPFDEQEVMWSLATRVQADQDIDIIKNVKGNTLDPSQIDDIMTTKMIVDATRPVRRPFAERIRIPDEVMERIKLKDYVTESAPVEVES